MRFAPIAALMLVLGLAPATALGHPGHDGASAMSLRAAARVCAGYTPAAEARLNRLERRVLGAGHAAEHAGARAQGRRRSCTSGGRLKRSFVVKMRAMRATSGRAAKRSHATGPPSQVGEWSAGSPIDVTGVHAVLLPTGKILYFNYGPSENGIAAVWDPATRTSHRADPTTQENIWCAGQTQLADGRVLVVGGNIPKTGANFRGLDSIYIFDPWTETWSFQGRMNEGRWYPTTTLLPNGQVVITSGLRRDGSGSINPDVDVFTPNPDPTKTGTITTVGQKVFNLYPHQFVVRDGKVIVTGPLRSDVGLLNPTNWTWSSVPQLGVDHYYGSAVLLPDGPTGSSKVMVISGDQQAATEVIDEENLGAGWSNRAPLPVHRRNANSVLTPDGALITMGGNGANNFDAPRFEALRYDPAANAWTELAAQAEPRGYHSTALLLPDGRIVSAGDDGPTGGGGQSDVIEVFSPPYLFKSGARPTISSAPGQIGFGAQFTVGTPNSDIASAVLVAPGSTTHANDMHQRLVPLVKSPVTGGYALTAPPSANAAPPGYYMLFLVNGQGVPSLARFIKLVSGPPPPPDTTPPAVSVSAPAAGATVSGTTPVSANASDNVGVVGVQFTLDGANLGAEDTSAPYSVSWNTTTASNGAHTLRAIARDAATNSTTSTPVGVTVSNTAPPPPTGLVAAYGFEETSGTAVTDSSPAGNPGTITGAAARTASGKIGRAIDFDGVNDYVSVADANSLDLTTGMTLEAWVQLDAIGSWRTTILKEKPGGLVYSLYANSSSARPQGEIVTGAGTDRLAGVGPALTPGTWTHLAVTYDNAQLRLFRNGVQVAQTASTGAIQVSANPLRIGGNAIWGEYTDGRIDEVRVYNRALSAAEITTDMTRPVGGGTPPPPPPPDTTPPAVSVSAPAAGATVSGTTPVSANASDNVGVVGVQFTLDGANLGAEDTSAPYSVSWNTTTASNGAHTLRAIARDAATNSTTSAAVGVTVSNAAPDTTPPAVSVSAPAAGATVSGTTPVSANASDNVGVVGVQFTLDGANLGAEDTSAPYSVSWNTTTASNGAHTLRAIARDAATNSTTSTPVGVTVSNTAPPPPTGLVAAYGFEETSGTAVTDSSPAGNPGTITGAAARTASGKIGRAIDFDGVNDYVSVADANSLDLTTGMTLEAWVQLDAIGSWRTTILKEKPGGLVYSLYANSSSARPQGEIVTGAGTDRLAGVGPALTPGTWTHLAVTYDNAQLRLFRNGVQVAQTASTGAIQVSANPLRIGGNAIWGEYTDGRIDEVRVYNRALSAAEITTDMTRPVV